MSSKKITMNNLKVIRKNKNITQVKLSFMGDVSQSSIVAYETGNKLPSVETLVRLADSLDTSTDYLIDRTDNQIAINEINKLNKDEYIELLNNFKKLSNHNKDKAYSYIQGLVDSERSSN
jgi:transcriptional regulator with XRE-family HTH domain